MLLGKGMFINAVYFISVFNSRFVLEEVTRMREHRYHVAERRVHASVSIRLLKCILISVSCIVILNSLPGHAITFASGTDSVSSVVLL